MVAACDCPTMGAMAVRDAHDLATDDEVFEIYRAFEDFQAWTGEETLCVHGVKIERLPFVGGRYLGSHRWIWLDHEWLPVAHQAAMHELCHAWDAQHGFVSLDHPDVFIVEDTAVPDGDDSSRLGRLESFAYACEEGPVYRGLEIAIEEVCGLDLLDARRRFVQQRVFTEYQPEWPVVDGPAVDLERLPLEGAAWYAGTAGGEVFALDYSDTRFRLHRLDPRTGTRLSTVPLPGAVHNARHDYLVVDGRREPLLLEESPMGVRGWRVMSDGGFREVRLPPLESLDRFGAGWVCGSTAWMSFESTGSGWVLAEVDLTTGGWREVVLWGPEGGTRNIMALSIQETEGELLVFDAYDGDRLVVHDLDSGRTRPLWLDLRIGHVAAAVRRPDGRLALMLELELVPGDHSQDIFLPVVREPDEGGWRIAAAACDGSGIHRIQEHHHFGDYGRFLAVGDEVSFLEVLHGGQSSEPSLTRIAVP